MEMIIQIIGAEEIANNVVKLTCIPYTSKQIREKHKSFLSMATTGMNVSDMVQEIQGHQQKKHILYINRDEWRHEFKNRLYSTIKVNIALDKFIPDKEEK